MPEARVRPVPSLAGHSEGADSRSRERWLLLLILCVGFLLRLTYLLEISRAPDFDAPQFEAQYHDFWARALLSGDWTPPTGVTDPQIPHRPYFRPPGYPFFLAAGYALAGPSYVWPRVVQMLLGLASCLLLYRLARRGFGAAAALSTTALAAVYWAFIFFEGELMAVGLLIFLMLVLLNLAVGWIDAFTMRSALGVGAVLGLTILVRPNAAVLAPVLLLWAGWLAWRRRGQSPLWRQRLLWPTVVFLASAALTTLPATLRNVAVAQDWVWITSNAGVNLFVGNHPESNGFQAGVSELGAISGLESGWDSFDYPLIAAGVEQLVGRPLKDSEVSGYFTGRALEYAVSQPRAVLGLMLKKLALFWGPAEISNNKVIHFERRSSSTLRFGPSFATVLALALAGLLFLFYRSLRSEPSSAPETAAASRRLELGVLLLLVVAGYCASFLPFFVSARFRAPIIPVLMVFAGHALAELWRALVDRRFQTLASGLAIVVLVRILAGIVWMPYEADEALWHWRKGLLWQAKGEHSTALAEFQKAASVDPNDAEISLSVAESLAATGKVEQATAAYRATLVLDARSVTAHNNLARLLASRGDAESAIDHWTTALELDPSRVSVLNNLAYALTRRADPERDDIRHAVQHAERAVELTERSDPRVLMTLAIAYQSAGRAAEAEDARQQAEHLARTASSR